MCLGFHVPSPSRHSYSLSELVGFERGGREISDEKQPYNRNFIMGSTDTPGGGGGERWEKGGVGRLGEGREKSETLPNPGC